MAPKTKSKTKTAAQTHQPAGRAVYRCRYCSQFFVTPAIWTTDNPPLSAWHTPCLPRTVGHGDLVAILLPGHPDHDHPLIGPTR